MNLTEIFELLSISPDADEAQIRKAYLEVLPKYHPEDDPAGFIRLRSAYEEALAFAAYKAEPALRVIRAGGSGCFC